MQGCEFLVRVWEDEDGVHLQVDRELQRLLQGVQNTLTQRLEQSADLQEFLVEFKDILERIGLGLLADAPPRADAMRCIVEEIEEVGWERVLSIDEQLQTLGLTIDDEAGRMHNVEVSFPVDYPLSSPDMRVATPRPFVLQWQRGSCLRDAVSQFQLFITSFRRFWEVCTRSAHSRVATRKLAQPHAVAPV